MMMHAGLINLFVRTTYEELEASRLRVVNGGFSASLDRIAVFLADDGGHRMDSFIRNFVCDYKIATVIKESLSKNCFP